MRHWIRGLTCGRRWLRWALICAPGLLFWGIFLAPLSNPEGRWYRTLGTPSVRSAGLTAGSCLGQRLPALRRQAAFIGLRFSLKGPKTDARVELRLLRGDAAPEDMAQLRQRTLQRVVVPHMRLRQDRFFRWELERPADLGRGGYLLALLERASRRATEVGLWLHTTARPAPHGGSRLDARAAPTLTSRPLRGQLVLEVGHPGSPRSFWPSLLSRWWGVALTLALALCSLGLVVLLVPRPGQLLGELRAALGQLRRPADATVSWRDWLLPVVMVAVAYVVLLLHKAWVTDDAFLTLRTVSNYVSGHGLTWNPGDRVQAYTHPLWMMLESLCFWPTKNAYFAAIVPSLLISPLVLLLLVARVARSGRGAITAMALLMFSAAFMDFNTSGLENPATHLLLVAFVACFLLPRQTRGTFLLQALLASLALLNRMDTILLYLPGLSWTGLTLLRQRTATPLQLLRLGLLALGPMAAWVLFSLFYYGFPVPNTAYAKLNTGIPRVALALQGLLYLLNSIAWDPPTLATLLGSLAVPLVARQRRLWCLVGGAWLYVAYVVSVGGDFMSGRFLAAPLLLAVTAWARLPMERLRNVVLPLGCLAGLALLAHLSPLRPDLIKNGPLDMGSGIADERRYYYKERGLLPRMLSKERFGARPGKRRSKSVKTLCGLAGIRGFHDGHKTPLVDPCALGDAFLARLPAQGSFTAEWRIGHFNRFLPVGYRHSVASGQNLLRDRQLALYYDRLVHVTQGDLFDPRRLAEVFRFNTGANDHLLEVFQPRLLQLSELATERADGSRWDQRGNAVLRLGGVEIDLDQTRFDRRLELSVHRTGEYMVLLFRRLRCVQRETLKVSPGRGMLTHRILLTPKARDRGYAMIRILPLRGDGRFSVGHLKLLKY